jgi:lipid-binding SYLF domain-containing protein
MTKNDKKSSCLGIFIVTVLMVGCSFLSTRVATAADASEEQEIVNKAAATFNNFMSDPDMGYLQEHVKNCKGLLIVPSLVKAGFIFGGSGGHGVLLVRDEKTGTWSQPAFYTVGSVSWGLEIGAQDSEVILMVRTRRGLESLYTSSFKLGADASVATGPVGAGASARGVTADMLSFARSKGAYAGLSLEGSVVGTMDKWNHAYYGKEVRPVDIIVSHEVSNPQSEKLRSELEKAGKK